MSSYLVSGRKYCFLRAIIDSVQIWSKTITDKNIDLLLFYKFEWRECFVEFCYKEWLVFKAVKLENMLKIEIWITLKSVERKYVIKTVKALYKSRKAWNELHCSACNVSNAMQCSAILCYAMTHFIRLSSGSMNSQWNSTKGEWNQKKV